MEPLASISCLDLVREPQDPVISSTSILQLHLLSTPNDSKPPAAFSSALFDHSPALLLGAPGSPPLEVPGRQLINPPQSAPALRATALMDTQQQSLQKHRQRREAERERKRALRA